MPESVLRERRRASEAGSGPRIKTKGGPVRASRESPARAKAAGRARGREGKGSSGGPEGVEKDVGEEQARCGMQLGAETQKHDLGHGRQSAEVPVRARGVLATAPEMQGTVSGLTAPLVGSGSG